MKVIKPLIGLVMVVAVVFSCVAAQCQATTKKGAQCKRQASPDSSYCWQHGGTTKAQRAVGMTVADVANCRCKATTRAGTQCKRSAQAGSDYCWQHVGESGNAENSTAVTPAVGNENKTGETAAPVTIERKQCTATTKSGKRCSRKALLGADKCWQHQ